MSDTLFPPMTHKMFMEAMKGPEPIPNVPDNLREEEEEERETEEFYDEEDEE